MPIGTKHDTGGIVSQKKAALPVQQSRLTYNPAAVAAGTKFSFAGLAE